YCCATVTGEDLCWESGPQKDVTTKDEVPYYFELTKDYEIPFPAYFSNPPPVNFPVGYGRFLKSTRDKILKAGIGLIQCSNARDFSTSSDEIKWDFLTLTPAGNLIIKKGYRWDGASRGLDRKEDKKKDDWLFATLRVDMRAALVHDAIYDLMRLRYIPCGASSQNGENYRRLADVLFYLFAKQDGHGFTGDGKDGIIGLRGEFDTLRLFGWTKSYDHIEEAASWRFHTLADAEISSNHDSMVIDEAGNKSITISSTCTTGTDEIVLNAQYSRPIANKPKVGVFQSSLHESSWEWRLNGINLAPEQTHVVGDDLALQPDKLKTTVTLDALIANGLTSGRDSLLTLHIDKGKNTDQGYFASDDEVMVSLDLNIEPPVITGISEPILACPPNHKFRTFMITDFISAVSDSCGDLSIDDLEIIKVSSDEAVKSCGYKH
ncbi:MAG: hypothetical protein GY799_14515, partial [Desulfobulbaceae bacterium]|nr:hypothetical protein [Desulfobulbaceae bacterium]